MTNDIKKNIIQFIHDFNFNDYQYENQNIHYMKSTNNYKKSYKSAQQLLHNKQYDKAIDTYLQLISDEACQLLLPGLLLSLFFATFRAEYFEESLAIIKLAKKTNEMFTPFFSTDFDCYIRETENCINGYSKLNAHSLSDGFEE